MSELLQAPQELIEPTKQVINAAINKVRNGQVDSLNRQRITLEHRKAGKLFDITELGIVKTSEGIQQRDSLDSGLFIYEINLNKKGTPKSYGLGIQTPRSESEVTPGSISLLRRMKPETLETLASQLTEAAEAPEERFREAATTLFQREKGQQPW